MKFSFSRSLVLSSALVLAAVGSTRPRYGGTLRVQVAELPVLEASPMVAETLVRSDERGEIQPMLARSWQRDAEGKRWRFFLRSRVVMHDGTPLTPAIVAAALGAGASVSGQQVVVVAEPAGAEVLERLAGSKGAITKRGADGSVIGTGPFRVSKVEPGRRATLAAFEEHWAGRPFLDSVEYSTQRGSPAEALALPVSASRRSVPERLRLWTSPARELIALQLPAPVAEIFALTIDREAIANVITQRRGEPARGLLPDWLTGYAAVLPAGRDLGRARHLSAGKAPVALSVAAGDPLLRLIADRVALNARDAGLAVTVTPQPGTASRVVRVRLPSNNAAQDLAFVGQALGLAVPGGLASPQALFEAERALLADSGIVPIVHIPEVWAVDPRVHNWDPLHLETVWMEP